MEEEGKDDAVEKIIQCTFYSSKGKTLRDSELKAIWWRLAERLTAQGDHLALTLSRAHHAWWPQGYYDEGR